MCVYIHIYTYAYTCIHTLHYIHYLSLCIYIYIHICIHVYMLFVLLCFVYLLCFVCLLLFLTSCSLYDVICLLLFMVPLRASRRLALRDLCELCAVRLTPELTSLEKRKINSTYVRNTNLLDLWGWGRGSLFHW